MYNPSIARHVAVSLVVTLALATACGRAGSPAGPERPVLPPPSITSISPAIGATGGGTSLRLVGSGLNRAAVVRFDGIWVAHRFDSRDALFTTMFLDSPPHAAGAIDVVLTNPDGASTRLTGGYTYVPAASFDANRAWSAAAHDGSDRTLTFRIENDRLVSATCFGNAGEIVHLALPAAVSVIASEFSFEAPDGTAMSGRMVAATEMVGTMNVGPCTGMHWKTYPPTEMGTADHGKR